MDKLLHISLSWHFFGTVFLTWLLVRFLMCTFRCQEACNKMLPPIKKILRTAGGVLRPDEAWEKSDFWFPAWVGLFELLAYPGLFVVDQPKAIGAWIGLKTVAQWSRWKEDRNPFNRFLIGNALNLGLSYLIARFILLPK